ncbi:response regulator transcription factor [Streptomyces sp. NBC_00847]|uniref:response regulator transcription factor n=1 Tax=Streptomyces sp. NBC_00847 TaxID=2975850 RepID=UPI002258D408|nr:response regulator transcription factor [Streptomyces sp. NBC_00847]MCX4883975.1 response regulator transcription factor [Streptomyces sp. NBC_00847]
MRIDLRCEDPALLADLKQILESQSFPTLVTKTRPQIIIISHIHPLDSINTLHHTRKSAPQAPVLLVAREAQDCDIRKMLTMGVFGILLQKTCNQYISWALQAISNGCHAFSPEISKSMIEEYLAAAPSPSQQSAKERVHSLSSREQEVLQLLSRGMSNREIATRLFISPETVKDHVRAIRSKLGVANRVHAAQIAWLSRGSAPLRAVQEHEFTVQSR